MQISSLVVGVAVSGGTQVQQLMGAAVGEAILGVIIMWCYFSFGISIYRYKVPRLFLFFLINTFLALAISSVLDTIVVRRDNRSKILVYSPLFAIAINFTGFINLSHRRYISPLP